MPKKILTRLLSESGAESSNQTPSGALPEPMQSGQGKGNDSMIGLRFGRLLVSSYAEKRGTMKYWNCVCDCGAKKMARGAHMRAGRTSSCGCLSIDLTVSRSTTHGKTGSPEYISWIAMRQRCRDRNHIEYQRYGGRGITVCPRWIDSFENFLSDMGPRPNGMSIERKKTSGNYEPDNCVWATDKEQARNTRRTVLSLSIADEVRKLRELGMSAKKIGLELNISKSCAGNVIFSNQWSR